MSDVHQSPSVQRCIVFGRRLLLPVDTAVQIQVGIVAAHVFPDGSVNYSVALRAILSHTNLPDRKLVFGGVAGCGLDFPVVSNLRSDPVSQKKQAQTWKKEHQRIDPIFRAMEDSFIEQYLAGEVLFSPLRDLFFEKYGQSIRVSKRVRKPK